MRLITSLVLEVEVVEVLFTYIHIYDCARKKTHSNIVTLAGVDLKWTEISTCNST